MCEIREPHQLIANYARKTSRFLMRQFEKLVEQAELPDDLERRGVNGIAAEIAEKIRMLLKDHHLNAGVREQEAQHHSGGPAASDAATGGQRIVVADSRHSPRMSA